MLRSPHAMQGRRVRQSAFVLLLSFSPDGPGRISNLKRSIYIPMAEKLKIIPLGGLNEIGKNMTAYEYGGEIIVVDCGMAFPGDDMYGIDCVIPDVTYLVKNRTRLRGLFITHGHEDHIGAIPYVLKQINLPIYCTRFTAGLIKLKLQEHGLVSSTRLITVEPGQTVRAGKFQVEFIHVNHSIADSVAFAIHTRMGTVVHTGDFKIDSTPIDGEVIDLARFGQLGREGVLALLADSTNVERPGYTMSEKAVGATFKRQFTGCDKRIIVTTFASNVHRIQQVLDAAAACGRKVAVTGRSMENIMKVSTELGYMKVPKNTLMDINRIKGLPLSQQVIVTTGSQGEEMSALYRMAFSTHKQVDIGPGDKVIISASAIPGNEVTVGRVINELFRKGADVVYDKADMLHVSGHRARRRGVRGRRRRGRSGRGGAERPEAAGGGWYGGHRAAHVQPRPPAAVPAGDRDKGLRVRKGVRGAAGQPAAGGHGDGGQPVRQEAPGRGRRVPRRQVRCVRVSLQDHEAQPHDHPHGDEAVKRAYSEREPPPGGSLFCDI